MNYIVTKNRTFFEKIGQYNYCSLQEMGVALPSGVAIDSETTGLFPLLDDLFAVQLGTGRDNFLIDLQEYQGLPSYKGRVELNQTFAEVIPYLKDRHLVFHNSMFDIGFLMKNGFVPKMEHVWDSMLASRILHNGDVMMRHNFGAVMERELGQVYDKTEQKNIHRVKLSTPSAIRYCFNDVDRLKEAHEKLFKKLAAYGGHKTYNLNRQVVLPLVYMELCGIPISEEMWRAKLNEDKAEAFRAAEAVREYIWDNLPEYRTNQADLFLAQSKEIKPLLSSPKQMIPVFNKFGIKTEVDDKKGGTKDSIEEGVIKLSGHEFVKLWLAYKEAQHSVNNFGANILGEIRDGRIYVKYNPMVDTCRISAKEEGSMNALNVPATERTRKCFKASPGYVMIVADYEAQEGVVLADRSQDPVMVASVLEGLDLHCAFARLAFPEIEQLDDETIKVEHKPKRDFVKSPRFAFSYGGGAYTVNAASGMGMEKAQYLEDKFKELHPGVYEWGDKVLAEALKVGYIESVDGWRLKLPFYDEYLASKRKIESLTEENWAMYRIGKEQYKTKKELDEEGKKYKIHDREAYDFYCDWKKPVSRHFKRLGEYRRLCLNNPIQTTGAHQTKLALVKLFQHIVDRGHLWIARIVLSPYDEIGMEVRKDLAEEYKEVLGRVMREAGNHYLYSGILKIKADAKIGDSWYSAK